MALFVASVTFVFWLTGLATHLIAVLHTASPLEIGLFVCVRAFLHTGLFITAHEAMHGNISANYRINQAVGQAALWLYAGLDYQNLRTNHHQHHQHPATDQDPDFFTQPENCFWPWYFAFMRRYHSGQQVQQLMIWLILLFLLIKSFHLPLSAIFNIGLVPLIFSSLQLFTFGIFLPHRPPWDDLTDFHKARSSDWPVLLSFLSCYHFGYHREHHQYPYVPWYELPKVKALTTVDPPLMQNSQNKNG